MKQFAKTLVLATGVIATGTIAFVVISIDYIMKSTVTPPSKLVLVRKSHRVY